MKKISLSISILIIYSFNITFAQSNSVQLNRLAIECEKGNTKSCEELKNIALNDTDMYVREAAVNKITDQNHLIYIAKNTSHSSTILDAVRKITDQNVLADVAKSHTPIWVREGAIERMTDQSVLADIAKNDESKFIRGAAILQITDQNILTYFAKNSKDLKLKLIALNRLDEDECYKQIIEIIDQNIKYKDDQNRDEDNLVAIGTLKIIPKDKILKNYYEILEIFIKMDENNSAYSGRWWRRLDFSIEVNTNNFKKSFFYMGRIGGEWEMVSFFGVLHMGHININEICEFLLSPLSKDDLRKISNESDVYYLRETAKQILNQ